MPDAKSDKVKIFISYASADKAQADRLIAALNENGYDCWIDKSGIEGGEDWVNAIEAGILNSDALVPIITSRSLSSRWVRREILWAEKKMKQIVHWVCEDVLDDSILLADCQAVTLFNTDFDIALSKLLKALPSPSSAFREKINWRSEQRDPVVAYVERLEKADSKRNKAVITVICILLAALLGFWGWRYFKQPAEVLRYTIVEAGEGSYRFRFIAPTSGYLYIVSTTSPEINDGSTHWVYLSNNPDKMMKIQSNFLYPAQSFSFPGEGRIGITVSSTATKEHPAENPYWLVWSASKLEEQKFYSGPMGKLESNESKYLEALCAQTEKAHRPKILKDSEGNFAIMAYYSLSIPFDSPEPFATKIVVSWPR